MNASCSHSSGRFARNWRPGRRPTPTARMRSRRTISQESSPPQRPISSEKNSPASAPSTLTQYPNLPRQGPAARRQSRLLWRALSEAGQASSRFLHPVPAEILHVAWPPGTRRRAMVARRSGLTQDAIASIVEQEFESNRERAFPLSSEFIGELMGIPPALSGKNTTVDQRISRALRG